MRIFGEADALRRPVGAVIVLSGLLLAGAICSAQDKPADAPPPPPPQNLPDAPQPAPSPSTQPPAKKQQSENRAQLAAEKTKEATMGALYMARDWESRWVTGIIIRENEERIPLTSEQRREFYLKQTFTTPGPYLKRMFVAGFDQARGVPYQWDDGWTGYTERFASRYGQFIAYNSIASLGNAKLHYEPRYDRCRCTGFWPRVGHAVMRNFLTYNDTEEQLRPQLAMYVGAFGGGLISTAWKPKPRNAFAEGGRAAAEQGGYGIAWNIFLEFAGEINRKLGAKQ